MPLDNPAPGPNSAAEYMVSGVPYLTSSVLAASGSIGIDFPFVTRTVKVRNFGANPLQVGVTQLGTVGPAATNYFVIPAGGSEEFWIRTRRLWAYSAAGSSVSICAGLTTIPSRNFPILTGSSDTAIPGVG